MAMAPAAALLRQLLARDQALILPGAYDALSARIAAQAGFEALYLSGSSVAASLLGKPDVGLTTATEMVEVARRLILSTELPVIADADTGYGNVLNVMHTVRTYEMAGLAGLHIEDQLAPKRCGHFEGKALVPAGEMIGKIRAAIDARRTTDFLIIARTDAIAVEGFEAAINRARAYDSAGADAIFVEAPRSKDQYRAIGEALKDTILVADVTEGGQSPALSAREYYKLGFKIVLFSASAIRAVMKTLQVLYHHMAKNETTSDLSQLIIGFHERNHLLGLNEAYQIEQRYVDVAYGSAPKWPQK